MKKRVFLNTNERKKIGEEYLKGNSSLKLAKKYDCDKKTILNILKKLQIKRKSTSVANRKYSVNENYFEKRGSVDKRSRKCQGLGPSRYVGDRLD